jgi:asparagine synthase (glutamine-hydrolysing)
MSLLTGGNVLYYGLAHSYSLYKLIDFSNLGIIHTGQLGDAVIGTIIKNYSKDSLHKLGYAYSDTCVDHVKTEAVHFSGFPELETSALYQRGINGANNGLLSEQDFSETMSPFYNVDFFSYCLSIPLNARMRHHIYKKWILKKHPGAAAYIWEASKMKINQSTVYIRIGNKRIPFHQLPASFLRKVGLKKKPGQTKQNMNPLDYWYTINADIKSFQDNYFADNIHRIEAFPELQKVSTQLYHQGDAVEKNQVLTLLSAVKLFF